MDDEPRRLRADAERNRRRLIEAATEMFCDRGLDVGVGEIAQRAGVGRGTLFRNFPSKDKLIAAVVVDRLQESMERGRAALDTPDPGEALFDLLDTVFERQETDRALFDALDDTWMAKPEIRAVHAEMLELLDQLVQRAQAAGAVRDDVSAVDILLLIKGMCEAAQAFSHVDAEIAGRQLDLARAALSTEAPPRPLRGRAPTIADLERAVDSVCRASVSTEPAPAESAVPGSATG